MAESLFKLVAPYEPTGDQPEAIRRLTEGILRGDREQTLKGVTGSGKTFTMANVIANVNRPTLILSHNKNPCRPTLQRISFLFPRKCGGIFCFLIDFLSKNSVFKRVLRTS